jgi:hypothetical protein
LRSGRGDCYASTLADTSRAAPAPAAGLQQAAACSGCCHTLLGSAGDKKRRKAATIALRRR